MKTIEAEGLCIKSIDYGDADKLVTVYLRGTGKILCRSRGVRKPNAKLKHAVAPFNYANYIILENNGYYTLRTCETINSHINISADIERYYLSSLMIELLDKFVSEGDETDELLDTVLNFLDNIETITSLGLCNAYLYEFISRVGFALPINAITFKDNSVKTALLQAAEGNIVQDNELKLFAYMIKHIERCGDIKLKTVGEIFSLYAVHNEALE